MFNASELQQLYSTTSEKTLVRWEAHPGRGEVMQQAFYDPRKLAITSGIKPALTASLHKLLCEINEQAAGDPLADAMPLSGLHFTFFAITMPIYQCADIADIDPDLANIFAKNAKNHLVSINNLRLVALPNQLLVAGTPDAKSHTAKESFARQLLASPWRNKLRERHGDIPLPPPFWHSTILRYQAEFLPARFREYFLAHQADDYGSVSAPVKLAFTNYNWTEVYAC
ncbi:hypothetical protein MUA02_13530 [Enterobacteriaceae bacterium H20N1]|uniref:Uncharacterized protein n=1 Tax=Dryocola boscaweniae TaxID=2925397 RepID=A0A9X3AQF9_9ENTR|nr:hypothetical protein [Dryocola boscaweniae]MCT4702875.1 hypothetical protein [Dryocola boscaweniae]MCT4715334.1 hypothetical protein [Dryocola boscaweniae]MCT4720043.1 hypothetical protein [Dryocola boscaweniae]